MRIFTVILFVFLQNHLWAAIESTDGLGFKDQINIAKDSRKPMSQRWKALMASAEVANFEQLALIKEFVNNKDWYMRNAALLALSKVNVNHAIEEARFLLKDKALVVRSAAVDVLSSQLNMTNRDILAAELEKSYNFSKKQSLWIRSKIFNIIATRAKPDDRAFFAKYVFDSDPKISSMAIDVLEKFTDIQYSGPERIALWKSHIKKNNW